MLRDCRAESRKEGLVFSGISPDKKFIEMIELPREVHPYFIACQFHPEYKSKPTEPHPLFVSYIAAALAEQQRRSKERQSVKSTVESTVPEIPSEIPA